MKRLTGCLTEVELYQAFREEMPVEELGPALHHVLNCALCYEQWQRFLLDAQVAEGIRSAVVGDALAADDAPGVAEAMDLPERLHLPGFKLRGDYIDGGQARVFRAVHEASQEVVAIKVFQNSPLNEGGYARFSRELQSLARLRHPNVIPIRSAGEIQGHAYYVMPWINGPPLDEHVRAQELSLRERLDMFTRVCSAVDHAHKRGVMHLDLKPSNVRIDVETGEPMVMDFGLARLVSGDAADRAGLAPGVAGTPAYMAPEQVSDRADVDTRTDVFGLGLLLYEIVAGRRAREADGDAPEESNRGFHLALQPPPPITGVARGVDQELAAIIGKATAFDREARYQTAAALHGDLRAHLAGRAVEAMGNGVVYRARKLSRKHLSIVLTVFVVFLFIAAALVFRRETERIAEEGYLRAANAASTVLPAKERELARAYEELAALHYVTGNHSLAEDYTLRAQAERRRAAAIEAQSQLHRDFEPPAAAP